MSSSSINYINENNNNNTNKYSKASSTIMTTTTTTASATRTLFNKLSTSSTSSVTSGMSLITTAFNTNDLLQTPSLPINPFEETNKFRLEQSVLSPNIFHVASTSTPERDTGNLWNIDQRAVLYPADIPTDESSLIAQYIYDNRINKQVSAAVEAFWTQNKIIIESPLATNTINNNNNNNNGLTASGSLKNRFGLSSGGSTNSSSGKKNINNKKSSFSVNSPLSYDIKNQFSSNRYGSGSISSISNSNYNINLNINNQNQESVNKTKLNKKDQSCQTILTLPFNIDLYSIPGLREYLKDNDESESPNNKNKLNNSIRKKLFDHNSDDLSSTTTTTAHNNEEDSLNSPKSKIHHKTIQNSSGLPRPDLFSSSDTKSAQQFKNLAQSSSDDWEESFEFNIKENQQNKILCDMGDDEDPNNDSVFEYKNYKTPDLSPLETATPKKLETDQMDISILNNNQFNKNLQHQHHSRYIHIDLDKSDNKQKLSSPNLSPIHNDVIKKADSSSRKKESLVLETSMNNSNSSNQCTKSIIYMDLVEKDEEKPRNLYTINANLSFIESDLAHENHFKREEIYTNQLYHSPNKLIDFKEDEQNLILTSNTTATTTNQNLTTSDLSRTNSLNLSSNLNKASNQNFNNENTIKKTASNETTTTNTFLDTGYQTNLVNSNSIYPNGSSTNSSTNPSLMDTTTNLNNKTNEFKKPTSLNLNLNLNQNSNKLCNATSTPMFFVLNSFDLKKDDILYNNKKIKKSSISLENIQPVESSTPEKLKNLNSFKLNKTNPSQFEYSDHICLKVYDSNSRNNLDYEEDEQTEEEYNKLLKLNNSLNDNFNKSKTRFDYSFMFCNKSILTPSKYAKNLIEQAKKDLKESNILIENLNMKNRIDLKKN